MASNWKFVSSSSPVPGQTPLLDGLNVWEHKWRRLEEPRVVVEDPLYHQQFEFDVYEIDANGQRIRFAAGEFSNLIYGFYQES
jgi:hypothetical protein